MKIAAPFEIKVALIGYVSVGKTTFLNALLKDKYSEVSMKRTTAGINKFRISTKPKDAETNQESGNWSPEECRTAESTLEEITKDNQNLRDADTLQEKTFDIEIDEHLVEMRKDTSLVFVDVPGINEAGASKKYKEYVVDNWHSFDCVIVMLDGRQGVNTEEQVELLGLVKSSCQNIKDISTIIVMNKIDDPDEAEQKVLVTEAKKEIQKIFNVPDLDKTLESVLSGKASLEQSSRPVSPLLLPMSAIHAFIYRAAATLTFDHFKEKIDPTLIDKLGREAYGRRWKRFGKGKKVEKAFEAIQDPDQFKDGLDESKFHQCLAAISFCVGTEATQQQLIEEQIRVSRSRLTPALNFVAELKALHDRSLKLGKSVEFVHSNFLTLFKGSVDAAFESVVEDQKNIQHLTKPMDDILSYIELLEYMGLTAAKNDEVIELAKDMIYRYIGELLGKSKWENKGLTNYDWMLIYGSILRVSHGDLFNKYFGSLAILLEREYHVMCNKCGPVNESNFSKGRYSCGKCNGQMSKSGNTWICHNCSQAFHFHSKAKTGSAESWCAYCNQSYTCDSYGRLLDSNNRCSSCKFITIAKPSGIDPLKYKLSADHRLRIEDVHSFEASVHLNFDLATLPSDPKHFGHVIWKFKQLVNRLNSLSAKRKEPSTTEEVESAAKKAK
uniref:Dynamin N-terminal domain-containing protein n=1 Tax=Entomoneis paludosa TaxID=265537 RepID=A0A6U3CFX6_9STRA|mmetsp:Transcript_3451/g.7174  ORF Transcript_3451/g.7174 Transcript_3451/m.7174 type:complete len:668 (+) Transcript_3451:518-2521(+)